MGEAFHFTVSIRYFIECSESIAIACTKSYDSCWQTMLKHITVKMVLIFSTEDFEEIMQWMAEGSSI